MSIDALLPPPLSRALRDAQADGTRAVREAVDDFLSKLDDELPAACVRRPRPARSAGPTAS
jgi:hypothetical protein